MEALGKGAATSAEKAGSGCASASFPPRTQTSDVYFFGLASGRVPSENPNFTEFLKDRTTTPAILEPVFPVGDCAVGVRVCTRLGPRGLPVGPHLRG